MSARACGLRSIAWMFSLGCLIALAGGDVEAQEVTVGAKGGLNASNLSVDDPNDPELLFDGRTSYRVGAFVQFGVGQTFAVQPEVYYSRRGARSRETSATALELDYVQVPLLFMARLSSRESPFYPILYAGPQVAFETGCRVTGEEGGTESSVDCDAPDLDGGPATTSTEVGLVFGGGFELLFNRITIQLDARYDLGLTDLSESADDGEATVKSRVWSFTAGVGVPIG